MCCCMQTVGNSGAIKSVQVKGPNSQWQGLHNIWGATWEIANQPSLPLDLHVTADNGQEVGQHCTQLKSRMFLETAY